VKYKCVLYGFHSFTDNVAGVCMCSKRVRFCILTSPVLSADDVNVDAPRDPDSMAATNADDQEQLGTPAPIQVDTVADTSIQSTENVNTDADMEVVWIATPRLYACDRDDVQTPARWLCDRVVNAAQHFLRLQYPSAAGLCDTVTVGCSIATTQWSQETVQVMFDSAKQHWFTLSSVGCADATVDIYDSMQSIPSDKSLKSVSKYVRVHSDVLTIRVLNVAKQKGASDCGLFAIAFATALLHKQDPVNVVFSQEQMQSHLHACLENHRMDPFPVTCQRTVRRRCTRQITVQLYCLCKTAYVNGEDMILCNSCSQWYHPACVGIEQVDYAELRADRSLKYTCVKCVQ